MPFSAQTLDFLFLNKLHDSREWFNERRDEYDAVVMEPMRKLVSNLAPVMMEIDPLLICEPKVNKSISRIFRDTRFSKDKSILSLPVILSKELLILFKFSFAFSNLFSNSPNALL